MLARLGFDASPNVAPYVQTARSVCDALPSALLADQLKVPAMTSMIYAQGVNRHGFDNHPAAANFVRAAVTIYCSALTYLLPTAAGQASPLPADSQFTYAMHLMAVPVTTDRDQDWLRSHARTYCDFFRNHGDVPPQQWFDQLVQFVSDDAPASPIAAIRALEDITTADTFMRAAVVFFCPDLIALVPTP